MALNYIEIPENKGKKETLDKLKEIVEEKNKKIASLFKVEPEENLTVKIFHSSGKISEKIFSQEREFKGYADGTNEILLVHPEAADGLFTDLWDEMGKLTEYVLVKYYLCKKYYPEKKDFKLYYKYVSDILAEIVSGKFQEKIARFEFKMYFPGKKLKKELELSLLLFLMKKNSGIEYVFDNLDKIMQDCDITKTTNDLYKKNLDELLLPIKEKTIEEDRKIEELEKQKRREAYNANRKNFNTQNAKRPNNNGPKFIRRDKFKAENKTNDRDFKRNNRPNSNRENRTNENKPLNKTQQRSGKEYVSKPKIN